MKNVRIYDNGGKSADRYTAVYLDTRHASAYGSILYDCRAMSSNPFHPQGIGQHSECRITKHLGKQIDFSDLPEDCQKAVIQDLD